MLENLLSFKKQPVEHKVNINHPFAILDIAKHVRTVAADAKKSARDLIILCIGTDRSTGDALGPITGSKLSSLRFEPRIYGTLDEPVHATNLSSILTYIQSSYSNPYIIAVDACLGKLESIGVVSLGPGSLKPGAAVNKNLPEVGNSYITGVVNVGGFMEHMVLQSTRLNLVMKMADTIAQGISFGVRS